MALMASLLARYGPDEDICEEQPTSSQLARALVNFRLAQSDGVPSPLPAPHSRVMLGSAGCAYNLEALQVSGVTHVVCLSPTTPHVFPSSFVYLEPRILLADDGTEASLQQFKGCISRALQFIDEALASENGRVLVHCAQGKSRSAALCIAYLKSKGMPFIDALAAVRSARAIACPNPTLSNYLKDI